jgi:hypothetical protein
MADQPQAIAQLRLEPGQPLGGGVATAVVDDHHLVRCYQGGPRTIGFPDRTLDVALLVEGGQDDGKL